jgi:hypothetical protein
MKCNDTLMSSTGRVLLQTALHNNNNNNNKKVTYIYIHTVYRCLKTECSGKHSNLIAGQFGILNKEELHKFMQSTYYWSR